MYDLPMDKCEKHWVARQFLYQAWKSLSRGGKPKAVEEYFYEDQCYLARMS